MTQVQREAAWDHGGQTEKLLYVLRVVLAVGSQEVRLSFVP